MGGASKTIEARTISDLKRAAQEWERDSRKSGMDVDAGWDRARVTETPDGYRITLHAHT